VYGVNYLINIMEKIIILFAYRDKNVPQGHNNPDLGGIR